MANKASRYPFNNWAKSIQGKLSSEYQESKSVLNHASTLGNIRETVVREILEALLPANSEIGTGQIIDSAGGISNQIDIIIARGNAPALRFKGKNSAFFYETVLATIEVKSMLYKEKLKESLDNCMSVKNLTYTLNIRSKGPKVFNDAFNWINSIGGLETLDKAYLEPDLKRTLDCPMEIWKVLRYVFFWLHWAKGDFKKPDFAAKVYPLLGESDFDFFVNLLIGLLKLEDKTTFFNEGFHKAEAIKEEFFQQLYIYLFYDNLPPSSYVFAYGGYENVDKLLNEVKSWYKSNLGKVEWWSMPRVILNHKMHMFRTFNQYHCNEYEFPVMFFAQALINDLQEDINYDVSFGLSTGLQKYFDMASLEAEHPKNSPTYKLWHMPFKNDSDGEIELPNQLAASPL